MYASFCSKQGMDDQHPQILDRTHFFRRQNEGQETENLGFSMYYHCGRTISNGFIYLFTQMPKQGTSRVCQERVS